MTAELRSDSRPWLPPKVQGLVQQEWISVIAVKPGSDENGAPGADRPEAVGGRPEPMSLRALARLPLQERHEILRKAKLVDHMDGMENWDALPWEESF